VDLRGTPPLAVCRPAECARLERAVAAIARVARLADLICIIRRPWNVVAAVTGRMSPVEPEAKPEEPLHMHLGLEVPASEGQRELVAQVEIDVREDRLIAVGSTPAVQFHDAP